VLEVEDIQFGLENYPTHHEITWHCEPSFSLGKENTLTVTGFHFDTITAVSPHRYSQNVPLYFVGPLSKDTTQTTEPHDLIQQHFESTYQWIKECMHLVTQHFPDPTGQSI
jgi:hypothetical protein